MASYPQTPSATVVNRGIYYSLPTYPSSIKSLKALVFGANGISGNYMIRILSQNLARWSEIVSVSRRAPPTSQRTGENVNHVQLDLLQDPKVIADTLISQKVQADYVFFFAYLQPTPKEGRIWSNAEEITLANIAKLASIRPKRFLLQTGAKHYGGHLGPVLHPASEEDPRIVLEPNFYYLQEDILYNYCERNNVQWNVVRPSFILGAVQDAAMNVVYPLAVYAAVQKHKGERLVFPGDTRSWEKDIGQSSAMLNSYFSEFVVLNVHASRLWIEMAKWYDMEYTYPDDEDASFQEITSPYKPPRGFGHPVITRFKYTFTQWAQRPENYAAWKELARNHALQGDPFEPAQLNRIFEFLDFAILPPYPFNMGITKSRKIRWSGFVDSIESHREVIQELISMEMVPPFN
ncbi:hypothetical protein F5884DRAFT_820119 [Xylogone sp. PMI_703]|nr:hypothetical protein F5884DRAFT_820119 [Xylogone sp. PMI_703]